MGMKVVDCHCFLYNKKLEELGVESAEEKVRMCFLADHVSGLRECKDSDGETSQDECVVYFKYGDSVVVDLSYDDLYKMIFNEP